MIHPFVYLGHGVATARKSMQLLVCFRSVVVETARKEIQRGVPEPVAHGFEWTDRIFYFCNEGDAIDGDVKRAYRKVVDPRFDEDQGLASGAQWVAFNEALDHWASQVNAAHPIEFFLKPIDPECATDTDQWHASSVAQMSDVVLPHLPSLEKNFRFAVTHSVALWRDWFRQQSASKQKKIRSSLSLEVLATMKRFGAFAATHIAPAYDPPPSKERALAIFREVVGSGVPGIQRHFDQALRRERNLDPQEFLDPKEWPHSFRSEHLRRVFDRYQDAKDQAVTREIALALLADGDDCWQWLFAVELEREDMPAAAVALRELLWRVVFHDYDNGPLACALEFYERKGKGEAETLALVFHSGKRWCTGFATDHERPKGTSAAPPSDFADRVADWVLQWIQQKPDVSAMSSDEIKGWLKWCTVVRSRRIAGCTRALIAEEKRRAEAHEQLREAKSHAEATRGLAEVLAVRHDPPALYQDAHCVSAVAPECSVELCLRIMKSPLTVRNTETYRRACTSFLYWSLETNQLDIAEADLAGAFLIAPEEPLFFANAACLFARQGNRQRALKHVALAIANGYSDIRQLHDEKDFAAWRGQKDFEALFRLVLG